MIGGFLGRVFAQGQRLSQLVIPATSPAPRLPLWLRLPNLHSFNFILLHYLYMILMTLIGSILLYPAGHLRYIDALFFAAGAATQSGLNTVDVNTLYLYQQIILVLVACFCNPIIINTFVVFVRLYWFEKRFQGVAKQAREFRRSRTRSRTKSEAKEDPDINHEERGVGGREIKVLHGGNGQASNSEKGGMTGHEAEKSSGSSTSQNGSESEQVVASNGHRLARVESQDEALSPGTVLPGTTSAAQPFHRDIVFADELSSSKPGVENEDRLPKPRPHEQHIAFVENQRNPKDKGALWIPGPRDVERGYVPQRVEEGDSSSDVERRASGEVPRSALDPQTPGEFNDDDHPLKVEPRSMRQQMHSGLAKLKPRRKGGDDSPKGLRAKLASGTRTLASHLSQDRDTSDPLPYLSYAATIGRNSTFVDLTEEQREELGGIEYRALKTLAWVLIGYYFGFFLLAWVIMVPWIVQDKRYSDIVRADGATPTWWGFFTAMSMFTDLGFTLTPDSMISFQTSVLPLLLGSFLIIIGNTGFPCMLRFIIWIASKCVPYGSGIWEEFRFLLDHPRRCFTLLFPQKATWWLFAVLVILNGLDLIFFVLLDLKDPTVTALSPGFQFLDGLFQAASTRTAGFACVNLAALHPAIQVSYLVMMYISVFPIAISVRQTNVYEEKSLGIYGGNEQEDSDPNSTSYLGSHLRRQLSFDLWYVFLGLFFICIIEGGRLQTTKDYAFNIFSVLFEIVSAYGTVGLSLGYPNINASFSAEFRTLSKLIIVAMMLRGRHRGLPYALDRAILLPSESLQRKDAEMDELRRERRASMASAHRPSVVTGMDTGAPPLLSQLPAPTTASRLTNVRTRTSSFGTQDGGDEKRGRSRSRHGLTRIVTGALSAGPAPKHYKHA